MSAGLVASGAINLYFSYRETRASLVNLQRKKAVTVSLSGSYVLRYQASDFEGVGPGTANLVTGTGALARWRHHAAIDWSRGAWGTTLAQTFQYGHREYDLTTRRSDGTFAGMRRVGSLSTWDLQVRFTGLRSLTTSAGVRNLLDRDPPAAYGPNTFQRGYDPSYADPRGRMFYLTMAYAIR